MSDLKVFQLLLFFIFIFSVATLGEQTYKLWCVFDKNKEKNISLLKCKMKKLAVLLFLLHFWGHIQTYERQ